VIKDLERDTVIEMVTGISQVNAGVERIIAKLGKSGRDMQFNVSAN
jgi:hypothetical protein